MMKHYKNIQMHYKSKQYKLTSKTVYLAYWTERLAGQWSASKRFGHFCVKRGKVMPLHKLCQIPLYSGRIKYSTVAKHQK